MCINTIVVPLLVWVLAIKLFDFPYRLGIDGQKTRCLPWFLFIVDVRPPPIIITGDLVQFRASNIGYGFDGRLFVKKVAGVSGDTIEVLSDRLYINGRYIDQLWLRGTLKKEPSAFDTKYTIKDGEFFVVGTEQGSFDSRYWGTVHAAQVTGKAIPII